MVTCALVLASLTSVVAAGAAGAVPHRPSDDSFRQDCTAGATCTGTASADDQTGAGSGAVAYDRSEPATGTEQVDARATFRRDVRLPKGTTAATVTATWRIDSASSLATSTRGAMLANTSLSANLLCNGGCVVTRGHRQVTLDCSAGGMDRCVDEPGADRSRAEGVELTVTTTVRDLAKPSLELVTTAAAFVEAGPHCGSSLSDGQVAPLQPDCTVTFDPEHAGTARSQIAAVLIGVSVAAS